jgi:hypothetical protein
MAVITAREVVDRAKTIIQDETGVRWPDIELLRWFNSAQRHIVLLKPDTSVLVEAVQLVAGTKQTLPDNGVMLLDVIRNLGVAGATPGRAITIIPREVLDAQRPEWHSETANATVKHFVYDERTPKTYFVYPPQPADPAQIEQARSISPTDCTLSEYDGVATSDSDTVISVDDVYEGPLLDLLLARAYSKDSDYAGNGVRSISHRDSAYQTLGIKEQVETANEPDAVIGRAT